MTRRARSERVFGGWPSPRRRCLALTGRARMAAMRAARPGSCSAISKPISALPKSRRWITVREKMMRKSTTPTAAP